LKPKTRELSWEISGKCGLLEKKDRGIGKIKEDKGFAR